MNKHFSFSHNCKRILLGLAAFLLFCAGNASAQDYIGGYFNFSSRSNRINESTTHNSSSCDIYMAPEIGWFIGDRWAAGIRPWIGFGNGTASDYHQEIRSFSLGVSPYARYQLLTYNRFGLWAEADPELYFERSRSEGDQPVQSDFRSTVWGLELVPVLTYQLNRHIFLESQLNLFGFSMIGTHTVRSSDREQNTFSCGLNASTRNIMDDTLGDIIIGFKYVF